MFCMRNCLTAVVVGFLTIISTPAHAQSDAEIALGNARKAFAAEQYEQARDLLITAAQTDAKNPDIHLLLGKSHYQLGDIKQAMLAWQTTLRFAPEQAYAKRMLARLKGEAVDAKTRLALAEALLQDRLYQQAAMELAKVRRETKLTDDERQRLLLLDADLALGIGKAPEALHQLEELAIRYPGQKDKLPAQLLGARAQVAAGGDLLAAGLATLEKLSKAETPLGARAELELLAFRFHQSAVGVDVVLGWIEKHAKHPAQPRAREVLLKAIEGLLMATDQGPPAKPKAKLTAEETKALVLAAKIYPTLLTSAQADTLTSSFVKHFQKRYHSDKTLATAGSALDELNKLVLPPSSKRLIATAQRNLTAQIATVEYAKIIGRLKQDIDDSTAMTKWIAANPDHANIVAARQTLLNYFLAATKRQKPSSKSSSLAATDVKALAVAANIYKNTDTVSDALRLTQQLDAHLKSRYTATGALKAAQQGYEKLLEQKIPASSKVLLLHGLADVQTRVAIERLTADAKERRIKSGPLPDSLKVVLATLEKINKLTPATPSFQKQAALARQVSALSSHLQWPAQPKTPKPTQNWAIEIALPVIADGHQPSAVQIADATIKAIVVKLSGIAQPSADGLAVEVQSRRLAVLDKTTAHWTAAMLHRADLLNAQAAKLFQRNVRQRRPDSNRKLSKPQRAMIETLRTLVTAHPSQAATAVSKLQAALAPSLAARHYDLVQSAYAALLPSLPPAQQFHVKLAQLRLLVRQVTDRDALAKQRGLSVKAELDPLMKKALSAAYEMQRGLVDKDLQIAQARSVLNSVTSYYRSLEMFDVVTAAINVRAEKAVPSADKFAQFLLAGLRYDTARREQERLLKKFRGRESIKFTPAFAAAEAAFQKFISDHPGDPLTFAAVEQLFALGRVFEDQQRSEIAAEVFARIEKFAAGIARLNEVPTGQPTTAERAALATAIARQQHALRTLNKQLADQPAGAKPPKKLSAEYTQAIAAYRAAIKSHPKGPLVKTAIANTLSIGLEYANRGAWDVADGVYAGVLEQKLPLARPERIELARAICQLGKVMPEHARQILAALAYGDRARSSEEGRVMLARNTVNEILGRLRLDGDLDAVPGEFKKDGFVISRIGPPLGNLAFSQGGKGGSGSGQAGSGRPSAGNKPSASGSEVPQPDNPITLPTLERSKYEEKRREAQLLAAVQRQQGLQATQIARLRDAAIHFRFTKSDDSKRKLPVKFASKMLSEAEFARQQRVLDKAYALLQTLRTRYPETATAQQARGEILVIIGHWRGLSKWQRAAQLAERFLKDNPTDAALPSIRQEIASDYLAWAAQGVKEKGSKQHLLDEVNRRHERARKELAGIVRDFPDNKALRHQAQWDVANSFLTQANVIATLSPTLARGQYVRSANELMQVAKKYHDHPRVGEVPQMLWNISLELSTRKYFDESISVWNSLANNFPLHALGQQAALKIAQTYQMQNKPLQAVEAYVELNFSRGGQDIAMQNAIYSLAVQLTSQKRWVEALHALETFVDSFPQHASAGQALTMIGQIHQANEVWKDAIAAYDRVILEYPSGTSVVDARWSIAECTINLSRWRDAIDSYEKFAKTYPKSKQAALAGGRIEILKDLDRYQRVVDEVGQRKSFDAQYQIGEIVRYKLANKVKAIMEYRKVVDKWPKSHLADDALYQIGVIYLGLGNTEKAREALLAAAEKYPTSPLADDALFMVGQSYEQEAAKFASVTHDRSVAEANDTVQRQAYHRSQDNRRFNRGRGDELVSKLKEQGKFDQADELVAKYAALNKSFDYANSQVIAGWARKEAQALTAEQLADRQDKVNAAYREAVVAFRRAAEMISGDKADDALLLMAQIYDRQLKDADAAMQTWQEIVKQFSGTSVAENASWKIAKYHQRHAKYREAIEAYRSFLRNYRGSPKAGEAQTAIAENYEHLGKWVDAMDAYTNYLNNFPKGPLVAKAKEQISWIKTYRL